MSARAVRAAIVLAALALTTAAAPAAADRSAPTKPGSMRVTAKSQTTVSLAWNASRDDSGRVTYNVRMWEEGRHVTVATLPQSQTTYTKTGLIPNVQYFFHVEAVDPSGNKTLSDGVYTTTDPDRTPPPAPAGLKVTHVSSSQVGLTWNVPPDDTGIRSYRILINGVLDPGGTPMGTDRTITYGVDGSNTFVLRAVDSAGNVSAPSNPFTLVLDDCT
jgi:chitinase